MSSATEQPDIRSSRLTPEEMEANFADLHPPLGRSEALIEADRCYFCFDAPCTTACPTGIDIPGFIQKIRSDNISGSAQTILSENIMGGMCARVCPTEVLCEEACVRNLHEEKPVEIGLLQRYATDPVIAARAQLFARAPSSGKTVAVVGGGPAGLSCAHRLAVLGHDVVIFNRDEKPSMISPRPRSTTSCRSVESSCATTWHLAPMSSCRSLSQSTMPFSLESVCRAPMSSASMVKPRMG
jgi:glutamate synthase (NADPH/NADH) small chain